MTRLSRSATMCLLACATLCVVALAQEQTVAPTFDKGQENAWTFVGEQWTMADGVLRQSSTGGLNAAVLKDPAFTDFDLSVHFNISAEGAGVHAAAVLFRATGTLSYYWLHLDSRSKNVMLTRSTPANTWEEITRVACPALTQDVWHTLRVTCTGADITVSVDDAQILTASDTVRTAGWVGLGTSQGNVSFRDFKVTGKVAQMPEPLKNEAPAFKRISIGEKSGTYQSFPDAARLANGDIMAVFYAGYGHVSVPNAQYPKGGRVCMVRSSDEARTWTAPEIAYDDEYDDRDPHVTQLKNGDVLLSFFRYWSDDAGTHFAPFVSRSTDGGKTFADPAQQVAPETWACSAPVRELKDGTLLLGLYQEGGGKAWGGVTRSTDGGATWSEPVAIGKEADKYLDAETDVIELNDGIIYAALRSSTVNMYAATSLDKGVTWNAAADMGFAGHAPHLFRASTGAILMTHRVPATAVHVSVDDARTWQGPYVLDTVGGAYPATVELKDHTFLAIYYEEGEGSAVRALRFKLVPGGIQTLPFD